MTDKTGSRVAEVVVITGASSGIGKETALRYAGRHCGLALAARSEDTLDEVARECRAAGAADVVVMPTDIADAEQVQRLFETAVDHFGQVDIVVQCAAITSFGRFSDVPTEVFDGIVRTNLLGSANVARCALTHFGQREAGHLVLVGSLLGVTAVPYQSAYVASKFALCGLVRTLRQEYRALPAVRIHGVYPGPVDTDVYSTASNYFGRTPRTPPTSVSPSTVVGAIVRATGGRRSSERQVGWLNWPAIAVYRLFPALFDAAIGPFLRTVAFTQDEADATNGNAFDSGSSVRALR